MNCPVRQVGAQYVTGEEWRNNSRKNDEMEPKQKQCPAEDVTGMEVKSNSVKNNIAQELGMLGPFNKLNWKWSNKKW